MTKNFWKGFKKIAEKRDTYEGPHHSMTGALIGGTVGHRAAKYIKATGNTNSDATIRVLASLGGAIHGSRIVGGASHKFLKDQKAGFNKLLDKKDRE